MFTSVLFVRMVFMWSFEVPCELIQISLHSVPYFSEDILDFYKTIKISNMESFLNKDLDTPHF